MATNHIQLIVPPERVFEVLSDPASYGDWVVGSTPSAMRTRTGPPSARASITASASGPFKVNDHTEVVEFDPQRKLVLHARARPMGTALVACSWSRATAVPG